MNLGSRFCEPIGFTLSQATKALRENRGIALLYFRPLHWMGVRGQRHAPAAPYPRERPGTHCIEGWMGLRAGLDWCGKFRPPPSPPEFDPRTFQPVGSCYTDYVTRPSVYLYLYYSSLYS